MITIDNLIICSVYLFFPISLYLNYTTYIKNIETEEKSIFLEFALITSLILMLRYTPVNTLFLTIISVPLIIALYKRNLKLYTILVLIISIVETRLNTLMFLVKYLIYAILSIILRKSFKKQFPLYVVYETLFLVFLCKDENLINIILTITIFTIFTVLTITLLKKGNQTIELSKILKELEHEKLLRSSISKLTHELKNPIAVCQGYLEMMKKNNRNKHKKYLKIITEEINRSKTIIDEFSSYGKLKKIDKEELDLGCLFEDIEELLSPLFKKNKANLAIEKKEEVYIEGDYNKLKQVFINLLKNTLEATKENRQLQVEISIKNTKNKAIVKVKDNGIGMSPETLSRVSEVFFTTKSNGTGLGLAYSKEVIELHNGTFKINSKLNQGTEITITIPKRKKSEDFNKRNY